MEQAGSGFLERRKYRRAILTGSQAAAEGKELVETIGERKGDGCFFAIVDPREVNGKVIAQSSNRLFSVVEVAIGLRPPELETRRAARQQSARLLEASALTFGKLKAAGEQLLGLFLSAGEGRQYCLLSQYVGEAVLVLKGDTPSLGSNLHRQLQSPMVVERMGGLTG